MVRLSDSNEVRPRLVTEGDTRSTGERSHLSLATALPQRSELDEGHVDMLNLSPRDRIVWDAAHLTGYLAGHEAGVKWADDRAASLHTEAVRVVRRMAGLPEVDPSESARRKALRGARWSH